MLLDENGCVNCSERVVNPVCKSCRSSQINTWLKDQNIQDFSKQKVNKELNNSLFPERKISGLTCVYCGGNEISLCTSCCFSGAATILKEANVPQDKLDNFNKVFNAQSMK